MAEARCPASCGELLQGWILGGEKLVSCPVDWFSTVCVVDGTPLPSERPLMRAALGAVLRYAGIPAQHSGTLRITFDSSIPLAKGMASSTADIAATAVATARHLGIFLPVDALAALCVSLEPTDSTLFPGLTLFDHLTGATTVPCGGLPGCEILLLESPNQLRTADFHQRDLRPILQGSAPALNRAWQLLQQACKTNNPWLLGEATTLSAVASQQFLAKPGFDALLSIVEGNNIYGINVAHSGSVVGLLLDSHHHDVEKITWQITHHAALAAHWPRYYLLRLIAGGVE
ncbi:GHMP family kinase ATP-binding protein [Mangrovibacter yixingensis]|uniref:GHMP family kinase ATP-binding protein n=1 Tax=Mangrovibacter yixingensis TaxID=1529639 RepID=UPI001CFAE258|nr:GHMP kinase [Mangrovibacter yixingensis]